MADVAAGAGAHRSFPPDADGGAALQCDSGTQSCQRGILLLLDSTLLYFTWSHALL